MEEEKIDSAWKNHGGENFILSSFNHNFSSLPITNNILVKKLNNLSYSFVWDNKPDKVNRKLTRLGQLGANISPDRSSLTPQVLIGNFLFNPFVECHKYWEKLYELQHINLLSLYLPKEDGVSPDVKYITQQIIFSIFLQ